MKRILIIISPILLLLGSFFVDLICINAEINKIFIIIIVFAFYALFCAFQFVLGREYGIESAEDNAIALVPIIISGLLSFLIYLLPFTREYIMMSGYIVFEEGMAYYFLGITFIVFPFLALIIGFIIGKKKRISVQ